MASSGSEVALGLGMTKLKEILLRPIDYESPSALKQERLQTDIALGVMTRQIRVHENQLRGKREEGFADIMAELLKVK